jgi:hypothetical protein
MVLSILAAGFFNPCAKGNVWAAETGVANARFTSVNSQQDQTAAPASTPSTKGPLGDHYLMLVNTAIASMMTPQKFAEFDKSPYEGIAVSFMYNYDTGPVPSVANMEEQMALWKKSTSKNIWPWVFINRMIATDDSQNNHYADQLYFHRFKGADLDGKDGAQADFLNNWKNSLRTASDTRQPGVVMDLEFYNNYKEYDIGVLGRQTGNTPDQVAALFRQLGARMADIAAEQYPKAMIWFLGTGLTFPQHSNYNTWVYFPSPTYVALGMLDEIHDRNFELKVLAGGESSMGYRHRNLQDFQAAIDKRAEMFVPYLRKYQGILELSGPLTLWSDASKKWDSEANTLDDLEPYLELLLKTYRYAWIWGAGNLGYLPFSPQSAPPFNAVISRAKARVYGAAAQ